MAKAKGKYKNQFNFEIPKPALMVSGWDDGGYMADMSPYLHTLCLDYQPCRLDGVPLTSLHHMFHL